MRNLLICLTAVTAISLCGRPATAALKTYYTENFDGADGVLGAPGSATDTEGLWSIDATGTLFENGNDFAQEVNGSFALRDLGANSESGASPGVNSGTATFLSSIAPIMVGNPAGFTFLTMTMSANLAGISAGSSVLIESLVNGVVTDSTLLTTAGFQAISHDISDNIIVGANTYQLRITATQDINTTFFLDNILVSGNATPEPASLSMLGMGVLAMCGAGYRRRRKPIVVE